MERNRKLGLPLITLFALLGAVAASAAVSTAGTLAGVTMPEKVTVAGTPLVLNGMGLRTATIFAAKVYVAGLYVKEKSTKEAELLAAPGPKQVRMQFLRDVSRDKIAGAWGDSLEKSRDQFAGDIEKLKALMPTVKEGDRMAYTILPDGVEVSVNDEAKGKIAGGAFAKAVLTTWLGDKPPTEDLKRGMLGLTEK